MLLGPVFRLNIPAIAQPGPLLDALGVSSPEELEKKIRDILDRSGQPATLSAWGARREELPACSSWHHQGTGRQQPGAH